jgi:CubicO group peptidase (beta-lactamase class C family)
MRQSGASARSLSASIAGIGRSAALALGLALLPAPAMAAATATCGAPSDMHDGWKTAVPAAEGLDPKLLCAIGPTLEKMKKADASGIVVVRNGVLVYEHYFLAWNAYTAHPLESVTKSIVAVLTGVAFDHGYLKNINAPVFSFFPQYADLRTPDKNRITVRDLLTMTSGLDWPEWAVSYNNPSNIVRRMEREPDSYRFVLKQPLAATPGTVWNYDGGGVELLGAILQKVSGRPLDQFAKEALFDPLGITDWMWDRMPNGELYARGGLWLRPRDLAKIGQLVLNHGTWHGHQIVSAAWIKQMTAPQLPRWYLLGVAGAYSYGYLWWLGRAWIADRNIEWVGGNGLGGQRLFVVPSLDLVVGVTASAYRRSSEAKLAGNTALSMAVRAAIAH